MLVFPLMMTAWATAWSHPAREQALSSLATLARVMLGVMAHEPEREPELALETQAQERELLMMEAWFHPNLD